MQYPSYLNTLIEHLKKLPGVGQKSAERFAFKILDWPEEQIQKFGQAFMNSGKHINHCSTCGALCEPNRCYYCDDSSRDQHLLCIVSQAKDIFALEETHAYRGLYHVLGSLLSPLEDPSEEPAFLPTLQNRLKNHEFNELIVALDSTIEGDATLLFLKKELDLNKYKVSRLAFGIPVGSSIDYIDGSTLSKALIGRQGF